MTGGFGGGMWQEWRKTEYTGWLWSWARGNLQKRANLETRSEGSRVVLECVLHEQN